MAWERFCRLNCCVLHQMDYQVVFLPISRAARLNADKIDG